MRLQMVKVHDFGTISTSYLSETLPTEEGNRSMNGSNDFDVSGPGKAMSRKWDLTSISYAT